MASTVKETSAVALDPSKAFNIVGHIELLENLYDSTLLCVYKRWGYYMIVRQSYVSAGKQVRSVPRSLYSSILTKAPPPLEL